jgi:hypothetical protein
MVVQMVVAELAVARAEETAEGATVVGMAEPVGMEARGEGWVRLGQVGGLVEGDTATVVAAQTAGTARSAHRNRRSRTLVRTC